MDNVVLFDSGNFAVAEVRKGEKLGGHERKTLSDISNLQERPKPTNLDLKKKSTTMTTKEYVDKLQKENAELMKLLTERNKLIELSVMELRKLRLNLQRVQLQNSQLAQANTQMLMELNTSKDRLKLLQHDLGCANGLLKARKLEAGERRKRVAANHKANNEASSGNCEELGKFSQADKVDIPDNGNQRKQSSKQSLGHLPVKTIHANEEVNKKRCCSRRQSARLKSKQSIATEDSFEVDDASFPVSSLHDDPVDASGQTSLELSTKKEDEGNVVSRSEDLDFPVKVVPAPEKTDKKRHSRRQSASFKTKEAEAIEDMLEVDDAKFHSSSLHKNVVDASGHTVLEMQVKEEDQENTTPGPASQELRRSSVGRPLRRAAEKIQSYKEIPINVKMRRTE